MSMLYFSDIEWDTEENGYIQDPVDLGLETDVELDIPPYMDEDEIQDMIDSGDIDELVDYLSDEFGWAVFDCNVELV